MDMKEGVRDLAKRSQVAVSTAQTEEATKNAVIMPFIRLLGFDVFDLRQVVPELIADVGTKKGEKVDYALKINDEIEILIEAKPINIDLGNSQYNQLFRYFSVTTARIGILSNGRQFWFFSDIDEPNKMDKKPFFIFDLESYDDADVRELEKFQREKFNIDNILRTASTMKYTSEASKIISAEMKNPSDDIVKIIARQFYDGNMTKSVVEQLRGPVKLAFDQIIRDRIQQRLSAALSPEPDQSATAPSPAPSDSGATDGRSEIETTEEELQGFYIIRAIASQDIDINRITIRDAKSYCSILIDDNNRKPLCRLYFNAKSVKYVGVFDEDKNETRVDINSVSDIYKCTPTIRKTVQKYL